MTAHTYSRLMGRPLCFTPVVSSSFLWPPCVFSSCGFFCFFFLLLSFFRRLFSAVWGRMSTILYGLQRTRHLTMHCQWGWLSTFSFFVPGDLDLWPLTLTFVLGRDFCISHQIAKFHRRMFNLSEVIVRTSKQTKWQTNRRQWKHSSCQISWWLVKQLLTYGDFSIFQDGGRRHVGFWKFQNFNGEIDQEGLIASTGEILRWWSNRCRDMGMFQCFKMTSAVIFDFGNVNI